MPVHGDLELSALISSSYGSNNSTKHWTPQLLFLGSCVCSKIGFLHRLCSSKFSMIPTKQNKELIVASKEIILAISSQPWSNDNAQV